MGIFVVKANNAVEFRPVKYIDFDDDRISLIGRELRDTRIVTEGNYLLKTGDLVKVMN